MNSNNLLVLAAGFLLDLSEDMLIDTLLRNNVRAKMQPSIFFRGCLPPTCRQHIYIYIKRQVCVCMHIYIYIYAHTYIRTYVRVYVHAFVRVPLLPRLTPKDRPNCKTPSFLVGWRVWVQQRVLCFSRTSVAFAIFRWSLSWIRRKFPRSIFLWRIVCRVKNWILSFQKVAF